MPTASRIAIACAVAASIAIAGWRTKSLTRSGAATSLAIGTIVFAVGGWSASTVLLTFFVGGSVLSRLPSLSDFQPAVATARNWKQVIANGWLPAVSLLYLIGHPEMREELTALFVGALATAAADTWATEIGERYGGRTLNIATFRPTKRGLSGGVSIWGTFASIVGALTIIVAFGLSSGFGDLCQFYGVPWVVPIAIGGFLGAIVDSLLGATIQAKYSCSTCGKIVEKSVHCGQRSFLVSGFGFIGNNWVNAIATAVGGLLSLFLLRYFG